MLRKLAAERSKSAIWNFTFIMASSSTNRSSVTLNCLLYIGSNRTGGMARHLRHQLEKYFAFTRTKGLEHGASHLELPFEKRLIDTLALIAQFHLNSPAIDIGSGTL